MPNAVITGATHGIGKAIAKKLLSEGFSIAVCARNQEELDSMSGTWLPDNDSLTGGRKEKRNGMSGTWYPDSDGMSGTWYPDSDSLAIHTFRADLSKKEDVIAFANKVKEEFAVVDILVNNAGIYIPGNIETEEDGHLEHLMNTNLFSAYHLTRQLLPSLHHSRKGHIFNICSVASLKAYPGGGSYSISKYALLGFSDNLREELKESNIRVTAISPGAVYSRSWSNSGVPESRIMQVGDIADILWTSYSLSAMANVDNIVLRPQKGDL